jgi:hypothetical protein
MGLRTDCRLIGQPPSRHKTSTSGGPSNGPSNAILRVVSPLLVVILGLAFGAADQQLGSYSGTLGAWSATAAQVSAPWLIVPFLVGSTQRHLRTAALLGLVATASALLGYFAMTYSPIEIHPWSLNRFFSGLVAITTRGWYNPMYILGGLVAGPIFGVLGQRWRVRRWWISAVIVSGSLCLEPIARWLVGELMVPASVWATEIAVGAAAAAVFAYVLTTSRRATSAGQA